MVGLRLRPREKKFLDTGIENWSNKWIHDFLEDMRERCAAMHERVYGITVLLEHNDSLARIKILMDQELVALQDLRGMIERLPMKASRDRRQEHKDFVDFCHNLRTHFKKARRAYWKLYRKDGYKRYSRQSLKRKMIDYNLRIGDFEKDIADITNRRRDIHQKQYVVDADTYSHMKLNDNLTWEYDLKIHQRRYVLLDTNILVKLFMKTIERNMLHVRIQPTGGAKVIMVSYVVEEFRNLIRKYNENLTDLRSYCARNGISEKEIHSRAAAFLQFLIKDLVVTPDNKAGRMAADFWEHLRKCRPTKSQDHFMGSADPVIIKKALELAKHSNVCVWTEDGDFKAFFYINKTMQSNPEKFLKILNTKGYYVESFDTYKRRIFIKDRV